jgi:hypothetical protein
MEAMYLDAELASLRAQRAAEDHALRLENRALRIQFKVCEAWDQFSKIRTAQPPSYAASNGKKTAARRRQPKTEGPAVGLRGLQHRAGCDSLADLASLIHVKTSTALTWQSIRPGAGSTKLLSELAERLGCVFDYDAE